MDSGAAAQAGGGLLYTLSAVLRALASPAGLAALGLGLALVAVADAIKKTELPTVLAAPTPRNEAILSRVPALREPYAPTPGLTNGHVETIFAAKARTAPEMAYRRELLAMDCGGTVALDWAEQPGKNIAKDAPILILFPGLTGGSDDTYVRWTAWYAQENGMNCVVFNSRGTADAPVTSAQFYSASFTDDARDVIDHVYRQHPDSLMYAAGWSLGANILINYLGGAGEDTPVDAAISMCNPFNLTISNKNLTTGFNQVYDKNLAKQLSSIFNKHKEVFESMDESDERKAKYDLAKAADCATIREFDEALTSVSFDWDTVDEYYEASGSFLNVPRVKIPMLCIQALDDPIAPAAAIPYDALQANENVITVTTVTGGHLGWVSGPGAPFGEPWTDPIVMQYLNSVQVELMRSRVESAGAQAERNEEVLATVEDRTERLLAQVDDADARLEEARAEARAARREADEAKTALAASEARVRELQEENEELKTDLASVRAAVDSQAEALNELRARMESLASQATAREDTSEADEVTTLREDVRGLRAELASVKQSMAGASTIEALRDDVRLLRGELASVQQQSRSPTVAMPDTPGAPTPEMVFAAVTAFMAQQQGWTPSTPKQVAGDPVTVSEGAGYWNN